MELISRIMVLLDQSPMDETMLQYLNAIAERTPVEEVYFVNVIRSFQLPEDIKKEFPDLEKKAIEDRKTQIEKFVDKHSHYSNKIKHEIIVKTGSSLRSVISLSKKLDITSVFVGRKHQKNDGVLPQRLARRLPCSLVIIPEGSFETFDNRKNNQVLVPIDFSEASKLALRQAIAFGTYAAKDTEVFAQHVLTVPSGYHYTGKTYNEFGDILKKNAQETYQKYIEDIDFGDIKVTPVFTINKDDKVSTIYQTANELNVNMIYFASKGRSGATAYFLGSTAEKIIKIDSKFPLVVIRRKNEFKSVLDSLMEL